MSAWDLLGIAPTQDIRAIKRAYSIKLKTTRPDDDAQAYQQLREAYDWAQNYAKFPVAFGGDETDELVTAIDNSQTSLAAVHAPAVAVKADLEPVPLAALQEPAVSLAATSEVEDVGVAQAPSVESLLKECTRLWSEYGSARLVQAWPGLQALLEELPITEHNRASRVFAQFVAEESDLPVEVLVALTRHFQWGLDFRVDQALGPLLAQAVYERLSAADVFAAFRPERYTQHDWALALAKLWDDKRHRWARLIALGLDCKVRHRVLQAPLNTLHALGASRPAAKATQDIVALGGVLQGIFFALLLIGAVVFLRAPGIAQKTVANTVVLGAVIGVTYAGLYDIFHGFRSTLMRIRGKLNLDWTALIPVAVAVLVYLDHHFSVLAGSSKYAVFLFCLVTLYLGIWLLALSDEQPWDILLMPAFCLLLFSLQGFLTELPVPFGVSLAFAWTMGAHVALRRYPERVEWVYSKLIKLQIVKSMSGPLLFVLYIPIIWVLTAITMLPILLFQMATNYRVLYAGLAIYAGVLLANVRGLEGQTFGLLAWVLGVVLSIQLLQMLSQRMAVYGLKKLQG